MVIENSDDNATTSTETEGGDDIGETVEPTEKADTSGEDAEVSYMSTKVLGDADCEVSYGFIFARCKSSYTRKISLIATQKQREQLMSVQSSL